MTTDAVTERFRIGEQLRSVSEPVARRLTEEYLADHPGFEAAHGARARQRTHEDFGYLTAFLASAIESGSVDAYRDFVLWTAHVLEARSVPRQVLDDSLRRLQSALSEHLEERHRPELARFVNAARGALAPAATGTPASQTGGASGHLPAGVYLQAILRGDRAAALTVALEALREGAAVADVYRDVLQEAMYEVGRRWEANEITVADEHLATAVTQWVLAQLYPRLDIPAPHRGRAVITGIEGETHQVGANMVADILEADGWSVRFLGSDVPTEAILAAVDDHAADAVGISMTTLLHLSRVEVLVRQLRERRGETLGVVLGGAGFRFRPELATELGADAFAGDVRDAVHVFRGVR